MSAKVSLRKAINDKCKECIYDPEDRGNWRQQVQGCTSPKCPLFAVRPISSVETPPELRVVG